VACSDPPSAISGKLRCNDRSTLSLKYEINNENITTTQKKYERNITITQKYENNQKTLKISNTRKKNIKKYQKSKNVGWEGRLGKTPRYLICLIT